MRETPQAERAWILLFELFETERPLFLARLAELDVSPVDVGILKELGEVDAVPMGELIACRFHDRSSVTRFADRLVKRGWIERKEHPDDRRVKVLSLTVEGVAARERILSSLSVPPPSVAGLPHEDQARLVEILERAITSARERIAAEHEGRERRQARG